MKSTNMVEEIPDLLRWHLARKWATVSVVIQFRGAASISMGRTSHETHDEMCPTRVR